MIPASERRFSMKRFAVLLGLIFIGAIAVVRAHQPQQQPAALEIQRVRENLFVIMGGGGNTAVFIAEKGVVLVDTKLPGMGPGILEKVRSVTSKPVSMVINTHTHGDHVGSNSAFTGAVEFVAHENCRTSMERMPGFQSDEGKQFLPGKIYKDKLSVLSGKDQIDLYHFGRGHTSGDSFIVFKSLGVVHTGDMFPRKGTPFIDGNHGGNGVEFPKTLMKAASGIRGVATVIPGHSAVTDWNAFKEFGEFMRDMVAAVEKAKRSGKTPDQIADEIKLPEKYSAYGMEGIKSNVNRIYADLN
jgi:cyclase